MQYGAKWRKPSQNKLSKLIKVRRRTQGSREAPPGTLTQTYLEYVTKIGWHSSCCFIATHRSTTFSDSIVIAIRHAPLVFSSSLIVVFLSSSSEPASEVVEEMPRVSSYHSVQVKNLVRQVRLPCGAMWQRKEKKNIRKEGNI